jgi:hypothetical protein
MKCQRCESTRVASISGKCSDFCFTRIGDKEHDGYAPQDMGLKNDYGDYVAFSWCLDCGQIQAKFPVPRCELEDSE